MGAKGTLSLYDYGRKVTSASCDVINICAREIIRDHFNKFIVSGDQNLQNVLELFQNNHNSFINILPVDAIDEESNTLCKTLLGDYMNLVLSFFLLQEEVSRNDSISKTNIENFLNSAESFQKVVNVEDACFWFEDYFWWRGKTRLFCNNTFVLNRHRTKDTQSNDYYSYNYGYNANPYSWYSPNYGEVEDSNNGLTAISAAIDTLTENYCSFEIFKEEESLRYTASLWDNVPCQNTPTTTTTTVRPPEEIIGPEPIIGTNDGSEDFQGGLPDGKNMLQI